MFISRTACAVALSVCLFGSAVFAETITTGPPSATLRVEWGDETWSVDLSALSSNVQRSNNGTWQMVGAWSPGGDSPSWFIDRKSVV